MFTLNNPVKTEDLSGYFVTSHACPMCSSVLVIEIPSHKLFEYNQGGLAHQVLSDFDADTRERFISGTCSPCWDSLFSFDDE